MHKFQVAVGKWLIACFGIRITYDKKERAHRFFEEATELVQSLGITREECYLLINYVYDREVGEPKQEVGGVMLTLAALCQANYFSMGKCGEKELRRVWTKVDAIRIKQANKPANSPLPQ